MAQPPSLTGMLLDHAQYASPVPAIGVYSALSTLVCFFCMLYDTYKGFCSKKLWFPCRAFPLNAFTLSLLSIATKLPVDLTTPMPRTQDQLSKLSSTTLMCICMGFFMPSLGIKQESECFWNMAGLSLLVVTVVADVSIQMFTGVIFFFKVEHLIVLACMLLLLAVMWSSILDINQGKRVTLDQNRRLFERGITGKRDPETMIQRLKWCYMYSFSSNPQFVLCQISHCATIGMLCIVCFVVLLVALSKTLDHKVSSTFGGVSDYRWSVWIAVWIQFFTTSLGTITVGLRAFTLVTHMNLGRFQLWNINMLKFLPYWIYESVFGKLCSLSFFKFSKIGPMNFLQVLEDLLGTILYIMQTCIVWTNNSVMFFCFLVRELIFLTCLMRNCCKNRFGFVDGSTAMRSTTEEEYQDVVYPAKNGLKKWIVSIGLEDMNRWMEVNKKDSPTHLNGFLCNNSPSKEDSLTEDLELIGRDYGYSVSCLSVVILVRIASVAFPSIYTQSLISTMDEAFEIVYFVDRKLKSENFDNKMKWMLAKDIWICRGITCHWFQKNFIGPSLKIYNSRTRSSSELDHALGIIEVLKKNSIGFLAPELQTIRGFIDKHGDYSSMEELYGQIKQLYVDMLHLFLSKLPKAIFKDVAESPIEESEKSVSLAMKFLCKVELLEEKIEWSYPYEIELINGLMKENYTDTDDSSSESEGTAGDDDQISSMEAMTENFAAVLATYIQGCSIMAENGITTGGQSSSMVVDEDVQDEIQELGEMQAVD
ncbi:hypothetical protein BVC80_8895g10 [Macleaya cordata]|uniref:Uncharacterized protein n=1 Tax=Macleaya cordata TaxID=56857 RepID=A0A200Q3V7_MACCD|nr:hypothetical protein BVC80_8895g10 [Macleaya cordata]